MLGSFPLNQLEQTPEICLMLSLHFVQSLQNLDSLQRELPRQVTVM